MLQKRKGSGMTPEQTSDIRGTVAPLSLSVVADTEDKLPVHSSPSLQTHTHAQKKSKHKPTVNASGVEERGLVVTVDSI